MALIFFQLTEGCISSQPFLAEWQYSTFPMTPSLIIFLAVRTPLKKIHHMACHEGDIVGNACLHHLHAVLIGQGNGFLAEYVYPRAPPPLMTGSL